jgi:hypothetical protein
MRARATWIAALLCAAMPAAAQDPFAGTWEARVATGSDTYVLRLTCRSRSDCELQRSDITQGGKPSAETMQFGSARPYPPTQGKNALSYALKHRADTGGNTEFAAIQKLLAGTVTARTAIDACISMDDRQPDFFFGSLVGLCGQGFCKHVVYPLVKTGPR